jgi:hypothetical protein
VSLELSRKPTVVDDVIMSGETIATHTQTVNQSLHFNKEFKKPELVQSSSVPVDFTENTTVKVNRVGKVGKDLSSSTKRLARSIDSKIATSQILENSASTSYKKESSLESSDKNTNHLYTNEVDNSDGGKAGEYYRHIQPTKTISVQQDNRAEIVKTTSLDRRVFDGQTHSGEEYGAPRGRSLSLSEPETPTISAVGRKKMDASQMAEESMKTGAETPGLPPASFRSNYGERKTNPDIQDIITGIVKLLNGNVKVQANPNLPPGAGRTRINNRGPPRITDVPPLPPDFDTSGPHPALSHRPPLPMPLQTSSRLPPPYPFDRPPAIVPLPPQPSEHHSHPDHPFMTGVPLPEQIVVVSNSNNGNRPPANQGIVRPHRPRPPRPRPSTKPNVNNNRRPQPIPLPDREQLLLSYTPGGNKKTQPEDHNIYVTVTDDKDNQDSKEHQYTTPQAPLTLQEEEEIVTTTTTSKSQPSPVHIPSNMSEEDEVSITTEETGDEVPNKAEEEQDKHSSDIKNPALNSSIDEPKIIATLTSSSSTVNEATKEALSVSPESTKGEEVVVLGGASSEVPILEPSIGVGVATPVLESSMQEILIHDSTASSEWGGSQGAATATATPTSVLPSSQPSLRGETSSSGASSATSSTSHPQDKLKQTTGEYRTHHFKNARSYTSTHPYVFMAWCLVKHKDNLTVSSVKNNGVTCTDISH